MLKKFATVLCLTGLLASSGCSTTDAMMSAADMFGNDALVSSLTSGLGLDAQQAAGGLGSIMSLARTELPSADFDTLSQYLPDAERYLKFAQDTGVFDDPIGTLAGLNDTMQSLGISPSMANQMYQAVGDYVGNAGGESARNMLMGLLT